MSSRLYCCFALCYTQMITFILVDVNFFYVYVKYTFSVAHNSVDLIRNLYL